jgi:acyl-CoA dehydrogenase
LFSCRIFDFVTGVEHRGTQGCAKTSGVYAAARKQFDVPVGKFEGVREVLERIVVNTYMIDSARAVTAAALDMGEERCG